MLINCVVYENGAKHADIPVARIGEHLALPGRFVWVALAGFAWVWLLALALGALLALTLSARVTVDTSGLRVSSAGLSWSRVPLERVASAGTTTVSPLREFGGWGWRIGVDGRRGYVTRAGEALVVHRIGEPDGPEVSLCLGSYDLWFDGGSGDDRLDGHHHDDVLRGGRGNDRMTGRDGNDTLIGGPGRDKATAGPDRDRCSAEVETSCER